VGWDVCFAGVVERGWVRLMEDLRCSRIGMSWKLMEIRMDRRLGLVRVM
jgi:hypothetical protein